MNKLLIWAVLCTACTGFAMDHLPCDQYPPSPGKTISEEDLKALLQVTRSVSPEEPRSASSSPIPEDPSQEQITVPAVASPEPVQIVHDFQTQFKRWIDTENVAAFRGFLKEHYDDAEEYVSDELVAFALQKAANQSEKAQEIYGVLNRLNFGRKNNLGGMEKINPFINNSEKIWHHTQDSQTICEADIRVIDHCACAPLSPAYSESEFETLTDPNFFQKKSLLNIALRDLIEEQKIDQIFDLVYELTKYDDCNLADVISNKTRDVAYQNMINKQTQISKTIYCIINEQTDDIPSIDIDTTAKSLERTLYAELDKVVLTKKGRQAMVRSKLLTWVENSDLDSLTLFCQNYESDAQIAKHVSHEILKTAEIMRDRTAELQELLYHETGHKLARNAHAIWQKLQQVVYNPCPVTFILSDEEENGPVYSEGQLDAQRVQNHVKNAFSFSTVESIVGSEKAEKIVLLLSQEKKEKKRGELDWVSPVSSPSDGLREYLGSFKTETLSD